MLVINVTMGVTIFIFVFLLVGWAYLSKYNKPIKDKARKEFCSRFNKVINPAAMVVTGFAAFLAFLSFGLWLYFKKLGISEDLFVYIGWIFSLSAIDLSFAIRLNHKYQKFV